MAKKGKPKLKPLGTRVLVREVEAQAEKGGILLPEDAKGDVDYRRAEVVAVGTEADKIKVAVGDQVLLDGYAGKEIEIDGEELLIVKSNDILAIIE